MWDFLTLAVASSLRFHFKISLRRGYWRGRHSRKAKACNSPIGANFLGKKIYSRLIMTNLAGRPTPKNDRIAVQHS